MRLFGVDWDVDDDAAGVDAAAAAAAGRGGGGLIWPRDTTSDEAWLWLGRLELDRAGRALRGIDFGFPAHLRVLGLNRLPLGVISLLLMMTPFFVLHPFGLNTGDPLRLVLQGLAIVHSYTWGPKKLVGALGQFHATGH